ncbi:MAG: sugar porter family MFS transporter [Sporolactobacillus sp.]
MGKRLKSFLIYFFGAIGGLLFGYDTGVISGALLFIQRDIPMNHFLQGAIVSILLLGAAIGSTIFGKLSDKKGRKFSFSIIAIVYIFGSLGSALAGEIYVLLISRLLLGFAVGGSTMLVPLYLSEMAPKRTRGQVGMLNILMIMLGILLAYLINFAFASIEGWRWMLGLAAVPALIMLIGSSFIPESPSWLLVHGKEERATRIMKLTKGPKEIRGTLQRFAARRKENRAKKQAAHPSILEKWVRPALIAGAGLALFQQLLGINTVIYYAPTIFRNAGLGNSASLLGTLGIGVLNVIAAFISMQLIDRLGRKVLLLGGSSGILISLISLSSLLFIFGNTTATAWWTVGLLCAFIVFFQGTWGAITWIMLPEIFPVRLRATGTALSSRMNWLGNLAISFVFPTLLARLGPAISFLIFAVNAALSIVFVWFLLPETKGISLDQVEKILHENYARWQARHNEKNATEKNG